MIKIFISTSLILLACALLAQDDNLDRNLYSQDTVFLLLKEGVKSTTYGKDNLDINKKYPEDKNRYYHLDNDPISFNNIYFTKVDLDIPFWFSESKEKFHKREYIQTPKLANKSVSYVSEILENKVLMMVDPSFADSTNYFVVRVFRYAGEE